MTQHAEHVEFLLGIPIFTWKGWNECGPGILEFYDVHFLFDSLEKYDGSTVLLNISWNLLEIREEDKNVFIKLNLFDVPEFVEALNKRIKTRNCC